MKKILKQKDYRTTFSPKGSELNCSAFTPTLKATNFLILGWIGRSQSVSSASRLIAYAFFLKDIVNVFYNGYLSSLLKRIFV